MDTIAHFRKYIDELKTGNTPLEFNLNEFSNVPKMTSRVIYAFDYAAGKMIFASGFDTVLGYPEKTIIDPAFIIGFVHPDDQAIVANLSQKALEYSSRIFSHGVKPWQGHLSLDYRVKKFDGTYVRVVRESVVLALNNFGHPTATLSVMTNIDHIKSKGDVCAKMFGPKADLVPLHSILDSQGKVSNLLSRREVQVLQHLGIGMQSTEIAEKLFISKHTVNNHRKNMLRKTGLKNTPELIRYGLDNGLL